MSDKQSKRDIVTKFTTAGACIAIAAAGFFTIVLFTDPSAFTALPDGGIELVHTIMLIIIFAVVLICREEVVAGRRDATKEVVEEIARLKAEWRAEWEKEKAR